VADAYSRCPFFRDDDVDLGDPLAGVVEPIGGFGGDEHPVLDDPAHPVRDARDTTGPEVTGRARLREYRELPPVSTARPAPTHG
jgi:hypothetical protein